jgi:predicted oxidoreductase
MKNTVTVRGKDVQQMLRRLISHRHGMIQRGFDKSNEITIRSAISILRNELDHCTNPTMHNMLRIIHQHRDKVVTINYGTASAFRHNREKILALLKHADSYAAGKLPKVYHHA